MEKIRIIPIEEKYAESYRKIVDRVARERKFLAITEGFSLEQTKLFMRESIKNKQPNFFAINEKDEVIGWCDIRPKDFKAEKHIGYLGIGVLSSYRGKGIGTKLLETSLKAATEKGLEKIELEVLASNIRAYKMYKKFGFFEEGKRLKALKINGYYYDIVLMGKLLLNKRR